MLRSVGVSEERATGRGRSGVLGGSKGAAEKTASRRPCLLRVGAKCAERHDYREGEGREPEEMKRKRNGDTEPGSGYGTTRAKARATRGRRGGCLVIFV